MTRASFAEQLRRFHAAVTGAAPLDTAFELVEQGDVPAHLRLGVYAYAYTSRIAGVLEADYPKLEIALADAATRGAARMPATSLRALTPEYLRAYPPAHPSLREAGGPVARYLVERGAAPYLADLARLERARTEALDGGADTAPITRAQLAALALEEFPGLRLALVASCQLVELATNADDIWNAIEIGAAIPTGAQLPASRVIAVWRRDGRVIHRLLEPDEATVIGMLAGSASRGLRFADACEALSDHPAPAERALALLLRWIDAAMLG